MDLQQMALLKVLMSQVKGFMSFIMAVNMEMPQVTIGMILIQPKINMTSYMALLMTSRTILAKLSLPNIMQNGMKNVQRRQWQGAI